MRFACLILAAAMLAGSAASARNAQPDDESVWRAFIVWFKAAPPRRDPIAGHAAALQAEGVAEPEIKRRMAIVGKLLGARSEWIEVFYDKTFARPLTGDPARDGFSAAPSAVLVDAVKGLSPGSALDAGMGQGRNAVYLACRGWAVTGFDLSSEAVAAAGKNAREAGATVNAIKATYADFDYGTLKWDLIVLAFAWAPVTDPVFVSKLHGSLRPGGRIVFEHFIDDPARPRPPVMYALKPGQLKEIFKDLRMERYEEVDGVGDWGGPGQRLVRMIAVKP